jgi:four helix bundle protein
MACRQSVDESFDDDMSGYSEWERSVPEAIKNDLLWRVQAYRLALFGADLGWDDVTQLAKDSRTIRLSGQLYDSLGSVSANISEGYGRSARKERAHFYEYALGSARESRDWYHLNFALPRNIQREKTSPNRSGLDRNGTAAPRRPGNPVGYLAWKSIQIGEDTPHRASPVMRQRESPVQRILGIPTLIFARAASKNQVLQGSPHSGR